MAVSGTYSRDANRVPIVQNGLVVTKSVTFTGNNTTVVVPIFKITGTVNIVGLYGIVTTAIGVNHTASSFRINDQTAQIYLTAIGGTALSAAPVGSMIIKNVLVGTAVTLKSSAAGAILEPASVNTPQFSPVMITQKTGGVETDIEYRYATTDAPTTGAMQFICQFLPVSTDGDVTAL